MRVYDPSIFKLVTSIREREKLLNLEFAKIVGISPSYLCAICAGRRKVPDNLIRKIEELYTLTEWEGLYMDIVKQETFFHLVTMKETKREMMKDIKALFLGIDKGTYDDDIATSLLLKLHMIQNKYVREI